MKFFRKMFGGIKKTSYLCIAIEKSTQTKVGESKSLMQKSLRSNDFVAQLVEQLTLNQWVESSSLSGVTKPNGKIKQIAETKTVSAIFVMSLSGRIKYIVGLRGVQFVNSLNREQFVHDGSISKRNFLTFCIFL